MADYGTLQTRIADEIARTDLTTQIQYAILSTIKRWERKRFYFNEKTGTFSTVANQEYYSSSDFSDLANLVEIDQLRISANGSLYDLDLRDFAWIDRHMTNASYVGAPIAYAFYKQSLRLYPIPDAVYVITAAYAYKLTALSASGDTNAWTNDAEELVRCGAIADLWGNVIKDYEAEARWRAREKYNAKVLFGQTVRQQSTGRFQPTSF